MELAYLLVVLGVIFLYFQLILGRICRWSSSWLIRKGAEASYNLSNLVATVALGLIPKEHSAAVWILYLTVLNNSLAAYDRENELLHFWTGVNIVLFCVRTVLTVGRAGLHGAAVPLAYVLVVATVLASAYCKIVIARASASKRYSEEVVAYMKRLKGVGGRDRMSAATLRGCRYAVTTDPLTTVGQIYKHNLDEEAGDNKVEQRRKELCLSFALFRLLFRRYHGLPCDEADLPETRHLVRYGLLVPLPRQEQEAAGSEYWRVFRVAEVELGFLHDHLHGGYVLWSRDHSICYRIIVLLKAFLMYVASPVLYIATASSGAGGGGGPPPPAASLSAWEFAALVFLHLFFDLLQIILYYTSDRWMVSYVCRSHTLQGARQSGFWRMMASLHKFRVACCCNVYWQNRVGQYCLLGETTRRTVSGAITTFLRQQTWDSRCARQSAPVRLPRRLQASIAHCLLRATSKATVDLAGVPSLGRRREWDQGHVLPRGEVTCDHKVQVILKWHIATSYLEMKLRTNGELPQVAGLPSSDYQVAGTLSRYCAYLVAFRPELLPVPDEHTRHTFRAVLDEVMGLVGGHLPNEDRLDTLEQRRRRTSPHVPSQTVTLSDGLDLGHLLFRRMKDRRYLGVVLRNVWVKLILSIAPQQSLGATCAKHHAKCLAQGGELVTQLWAILSNTGILEQSSWPQSQVPGGIGVGGGFIDKLSNHYSYELI